MTLKLPLFIVISKPSLLKTTTALNIQKAENIHWYFKFKNVTPEDVTVTAVCNELTEDQML